MIESDGSRHDHSSTEPTTIGGSLAPQRTEQGIGPTRSQSEHDGHTRDVREMLRGQVPDSVLSILNRHGVDPDYASQFPDLSTKSVTEYANIANTTESYSDYLFESERVREILQNEGMTGDALDIETDRVLDVLTEVTAARELDEAVDGIVRVSRDNPMAYVGAFETAAGVVGRVCAPEEVSESGQDVPEIAHSSDAYAKAAERGEQGEVTRIVLQDRTGEGVFDPGETPAEVQYVITRFGTEDRLARALTDPANPDAYRQMLTQTGKMFDAVDPRNQPTTSDTIGSLFTPTVPLDTTATNPPTDK